MSVSAEPKTNTRTASAAAPASIVSASTPNLFVAWPPLTSSFIPVARTWLPGGSARVIAAVICGARLGGDSSP
jgi:hypothetical protein